MFVPCETCGGSRFKREVLDVKIHGHSIHDVLQWTVEEAVSRFRHQPKLGVALWHLQQVGLGYLRLGQPATTLSGGEAQRLKIARELAQAGKKAGRKLYILDEPTTGLHLDDVRVLISVLDRLVDAGHTVLVIEHHMDVIKRADWVIDMGPEAGNDGGRVVAQGTPEAVAEVEGSHTGRYLKEVLEEPAFAREPACSPRHGERSSQWPARSCSERACAAANLELERRLAGDQRPGLLHVPQFRGAGTDRHADGVATIERRVRQVHLARRVHPGEQLAVALVARRPRPRPRVGAGESRRARAAREPSARSGCLPSPIRRPTRPIRSSAG